MKTLIKRALWMGVGVAERARGVAERLVQEGEASQSAEAQKVRAFVDSVEKGGEELRHKMDDLKARVGCCLPTRADVERIEKKLDDLLQQRQTNG